MSKDTDKVTAEDTLQEQETAVDTQDNNESTESQSTDNQSSIDNDSEATIAALQQEVESLQDKYRRLFSDFDNFKKRNIRERMDLLNSAAQDTLSALLPVIDDFDRALGLSPEQKQTAAFSEGIELVYHKFINTLKAKGLEVMDTNGQPFDPEFHEALTEIAAAEEMKGKVVDTIEKGYTLHGKIIRHAKVVTGK
ncbi:MAG: nucleotide exchange factor GrpE [Saprospiraceae bacterium]